MVEEIHLAHLPPDLAIYVACYKDVRNAPFLRQQLLASNQAYNYAFVDAASVLSRRHLLAACFRALNDYTHDRLKSNNPQSEVVFCLSPNNNIGDAFRRFGIQDSTKDLVVVKIGEAPEVTKQSVSDHLDSAVEGTAVEFTDAWVNEVSDVDRIKKTYKLAKPQQPKAVKLVNGSAGAGTEIDERLEMEVQILGLMALRGAS